MEVACLHGSSQPCGQANLVVQTAQQQGTKVRGQGPSFAISTDGVASNRRKVELFWARIAHKQTSWGFVRNGVLAHPILSKPYTRFVPFYEKFALSAPHSPYHFT